MTRALSLSIALTFVSTDLFAAIDNVSRSIRTATGGVETAKTDSGLAKSR